MALSRVETTQADWQAGTLSNVVATSAGDLVLANIPSQLYDDFSGDLSKWSPIGGATLSISSGQLDIKGAQSQAVRALSQKTFYGDGYIQADLKQVSPNTEIFLEMDTIDGSSYQLRCGLSGSTLFLQGLGLNLSKSYSYTSGTYYTFKIEKIGNTVNAYVNGSLQLSGTVTQSLGAWKIAPETWSGANATEIMVDNVYVKDSSYYASGTRTSPTLDLSPVGTAVSSKISWTATTPTNTAVAVDVSLDGGATWQSCTNGGSIPGIASGMSLSGKSLLVRQTLTTSDPSVTPTLSDLTVTVGALQSATGAAQAGGTVTSSARRFVFAVLSATLNSAMDWNEHIQAVSATAMAGSTLDVAAVRLLIQTLVVNAIIQPGDIVDIDTSRMTVKIYGVNALQFVEGDFFSLLPGENHLEYQDSEASRNVQVITRHRPRWL